MAYLKAKTGRDRLKMRGKKKLSFWSIQTWPGIRNFKKIAKKLKKLKNINMASFQAKTGRERLRMWEKKILVLIHSNPTRNRDSRKIAKKFKKLKNIIVAPFQAKQDGTGWEWEKKKMVPISSLPIRNIEFQKK